MKRPQWMAFFFALALLFCFAMPVGAFEIGARGLYWFPSFKADIKVDGAGLVGNNLNLKDTLGVGNESFPSFEVFVGHGRHRLFQQLPLRGAGRSLPDPVSVFRHPCRLQNDPA